MRRIAIDVLLTFIGAALLIEVGIFPAIERTAEINAKQDIHAQLARAQASCKVAWIETKPNGTSEVLGSECRSAR